MNLMKHRGEILRALASQQFEPHGPGGVLIRGGVDAVPMGVYDIQHRRNGKLVGRTMASNIIPTEGLNHILSTEVAGGAQVSPWYMALFEGNVTPLSTWTGANFAANATECTAYDEATRVAYVEGAVAAGSVDNGDNRAVFTMNAGKTVYGGALLESNTKGDTTGALLSAAKFAVARAVVAADELAVKFTLTLSSTG